MSAQGEPRSEQPSIEQRLHTLERRLERVDALERELRTLRDVEEIKALKARYWKACDGNIVVGPSHDYEEVVDLYTEDGSFEVAAFETPLDRQERRGGSGRDGLLAHFKRLRDWYTFIMHFGMAPIISVDGDRASGHWHFLATIHATDRDGIALWSGGTYEDEYVRTERGWRIESTVVLIGFRTPFDEGWHKTKYLDLVR